LNGRFLVDENTGIFAPKEVAQEASLLSEMLCSCTDKEISIENILGEDREISST
jgi:hypothetical protein